jgi:hypothetical protein
MVIVFWQSYEESRVQKIFCRDLPYDFEKSEIDIVPGFLILPNEHYHNFCLLTRAVAKCSK